MGTSVSSFFRVLFNLTLNKHLIVKQFFLVAYTQTIKFVCWVAVEKTITRSQITQSGGT